MADIYDIIERIEYKSRAEVARHKEILRICNDYRHQALTDIELITSLYKTLHGEGN